MHITKISIDSSKYFISNFMGISYFNFSFTVNQNSNLIIIFINKLFITIFRTLNTNIVNFL
jgi:hypothetical protein